jgi:putative oxidoreductase
VKAPDALRDWGPVAIRLFAGTFLIYMSQDNVFSWARMQEFAGFLRQFGFPLPLACAVVSVAAQFLAGIAFLLGVAVRWAAVAMILNFAVALAAVHTRLPFREALDPAAMLACAVSLFCTGAGAWSLARLRR